MINRDITFHLGNAFEHYVYDNKDVFYSREYLYNFEFKVIINNNDISINNLIVYKNGIEYKDCIVIQNAMNEYEIKDKQWIKFGNNNFKVEVILEGGKIYKNDFYLKVLSGYVQDDIKLLNFTTYGIHENFSYLDIMLKLDTKYTVDRVLLYYHIVPLTQINEKSYISEDSFKNERYDSRDIKWSYIGSMELKDYQFKYRHMLYDITMKNTPRTLLYKAVVVTINELKKSFIMSTVINPNTMSLNTISYAHTEKNKNYDITGGLVGRIKSKISKDSDVKNTEYDDRIFDLLIDKRGSRSFLSITIDNMYIFEAENIHIDYMRRLFNKNQTNRDPNWFQIYGEGVSTLTVDKEKNIYRKDNCRFSMNLWCGDDIFVEFNITPLNDATLAVNTEKTANNTIKYSYDGKTSLFDSTYKDKTVDVNSKIGFLTYNKEDDSIFFHSKNEKIKLIPNESLEYIKNCHNRIYNKENFYYITYDEYGIHIIKYDGINFEKIEYAVELTNQTITYLKIHNCVAFDKNDVLLIRFVNTDGVNILEKIIVERNELTVIDCKDMLIDVYNYLSKAITSFVDELNYVSYGNNNYYINRTGNYEILRKEVNSLNYDIFNQKMSIRQVIYEVRMEIEVKFKNITSNVNTIYKTYMTIGCVDDATFFDDNVSHGNIRFWYTINDSILNVSSLLKGKNMAIKVAYERVNKRYYFKFSKAVSSSVKDDFGFFRELTLYRTSYAMYKPTLQDIYGNDTTKQYFYYNDVVQSRIIQIEHNIIEIITWNDGKYVISGINTELKKQLYQKKYKSDLFFESYVSYTKEQLQSFETLLSQTYLYKTVPRKMLIFSVSDYENLYVFGIDSKQHRMKKIPSLSCNVGDSKNSYMIQYMFDYPLNIKNRNTYLKTIAFKSVDNSKNEEDIIYLTNRKKK